MRCFFFSNLFWWCWSQTDARGAQTECLAQSYTENNFSPGCHKTASTLASKHNEGQKDTKVEMQDRCSQACLSSPCLFTIHPQRLAGMQSSRGTWPESVDVHCLVCLWPPLSHVALYAQNQNLLLHFMLWHPSIENTSLNNTRQLRLLKVKGRHIVTYWNSLCGYKNTQ